MKNVMIVAWRIAKNGQQKFGGNVRDYLSEALKIAWELCRNDIKKTSRKVRLTTSVGSRNHKSWVAKITGNHSYYKFNRKFLESVDYNWVERYFELENGIYEVCDAGNRRFIKVTNGKITDIDENQVKEMVA